MQQTIGEKPYRARRGKAVPQDIVRTIEKLYAEQRDRDPNNKGLGVRTYEIAKLKLGNDICPKLRTVQNIIAHISPSITPLDPDPALTPWKGPWESEDPDSIDCLFRLHTKGLQDSSLIVTERIAKWALRLRTVFTGPVAKPEVDLDLLLLFAAYGYASRERGCLSLGNPLDTSDLDGVLSFRIWESQSNFRMYGEALDAGLIPGVALPGTDPADANSEEVVGRMAFWLSLFGPHLPEEFVELTKVSPDLAAFVIIFMTGILLGTQDLQLTKL